MVGNLSSVKKNHTCKICQYNLARFSVCIVVTAVVRKGIYDTEKVFFQDLASVYVYIFLKVYVEFVTVLLLYYVFVFWPRGMWHLT